MLLKTLIKTIIPSKLYSYIRRRYRSIGRYILFKIYFPMLYCIKSRKPVEDKQVVFIEVSRTELSDNLQLIWNALKETGRYHLELILLKQDTDHRKEYYRRCGDMIGTIATAKYVFLTEGLNVLGNIPFREETGIYNVWHACGAFKRFGMATADLIFGASRKTQERYPAYKYCTELYVSSPEVVGIYAESTGLPPEKIIPLGISRTDVFFRERFVTQAKAKMRAVFPQSAGKKIILYAPTFRGRTSNATTPDALSVPMFRAKLSDEYVLVVKHHPHVRRLPEIAQEDRGFAMDVTNLMSIEELLCAADICISDYSSVIFEYSLFLKPMVFYAFDKEEYDEWRGFYYDYSEMTPGPVFTTNEDMLEYIQHIDERFDIQEVIRFRDRFMSSCDGHVTERLIDRIFGKNWENA